MVDCISLEVFKQGLDHHLLVSPGVYVRRMWSSATDILFMSGMYDFFRHHGHLHVAVGLIRPEILL